MTGRHVAAAGGGGRGLGFPGLVRRAARTGAGTCALLVVLAALAAAYLVATPRVQARAADAALADVVAAAPAPEQEVRFRTLPVVVPERPEPSTTPRPGPPAPFAAVDAAARRVMGPRILPLLGAPTVAGETEEGAVTRGGDPLLPDGSTAVLRVQSGLDARVTWLEGGPPGAPTEERTVAATRDGPAHTVALVPVAVPVRTAQAWGLAVGDELLFRGPSDLTPALTVLSGVYEPRDRSDGFWQEDPRMTGLAAVPTSTGGVVTSGALVADLASWGPLTDAMWRAPDGGPEYPGSPVLDARWRYPLDPARLTAADVEPLRAFLVRLDTDPDLPRTTLRPLGSSTGLAGLLDRYEAAVRSVGVLTSFATAGLTALGALVLALTVVVALRRRAAEVRLVRARGAGVGQVLAQVAGGTVLPVLPAVLVVAVLTAALVPGTWTAGAATGAVLVALVPLLTAVVAVGLAVRALEHTDDTDEAARRHRVVRSARRVVAELAVLALTVLAVATVRARGGTIATGRTDWLAALAPVLVAVLAAVVAIRVLPWPVRALARLAARGRGLVGFLGLTRAARTGTTAVLPVVAVVVGAAVLALLGSLALSTGEERSVAAYRAVGADVRVDAVRVDPDDVDALAAVDGVRAVVPAYVEAGSLVSAGDAQRVLVVATDLTAYRDLLAGTPAALPSAPATAAGDALPVVVGPGLARGQDVRLTVRGIRLDVDVVGSDPGLVRTTAAGDLPAVLVPLDLLREQVPAARADVAFVAADAAAAAALTGSRDPGSLTPSGRVRAVESVDASTDRVAARALPRLVRATYLAGAALAAVLTLLAVLLLLAATRPERTGLVVRLRTMGLPHGGERALAWTEVLPVVAVAALAGAVVGTLAPALLAPAVDLSPLTGGAARPPVRPHLVTAAAAGTLVLVLGALALVLDAALARRGRLADHLRTGDTA